MASSKRAFTVSPESIVEALRIESYFRFSPKEVINENEMENGRRSRICPHVVRSKVGDTTLNLTNSDYLFQSMVPSKIAPFNKYEQSSITKFIPCSFIESLPDVIENPLVPSLKLARHHEQTSESSVREELWEN